MIEVKSPTSDRPALPEVALLFLRLGLTAFGGPAAHIAMMQAEVVERRGWMGREEFLDLLAAANLIPGPSSTELAILIGLRIAGRAGLALAGFCFILPAFMLVLALAWAYVRYGGVPEVGRALYGIKPVVIAIIAQALWNLGRTAVSSRERALLAGACLVPAALGVSPLAILLAAGLVAGCRRWLRDRSAANPASLAVVAAVLAAMLTAPLLQRFVPAAPPRYSLTALVWVFLKVGSVIYGSGYVLLAFLRADLVVQRHWLTNSQLLDSISIGQVTPGPVFTTATFIGFLLGGVPGAIAATAAIFLPAFLFSAIAGPAAARWRKSPLTSAMLTGATLASLALMAAVSWQLATAALVDWLTLALAIGSLIALVRFRINATWLIAAGALAGIAEGLLRR